MRREPLSMLAQSDLLDTLIGRCVMHGGAPAREGAEIADADGTVIGRVTSGGPSPTLGRNIATGYVPPAFADLGTALQVIVRGKAAPAEVVAMPFVAQRYYRKPVQPKA